MNLSKTQADALARVATLGAERAERKRNIDMALALLKPRVRRAAELGESRNQLAARVGLSWPAIDRWLIESGDVAPGDDLAAELEAVDTVGALLGKLREQDRATTEALREACRIACRHNVPVRRIADSSGVARSHVTGWIAGVHREPKAVSRFL